LDHPRSGHLGNLRKDTAIKLEEGEKTRGGKRNVQMGKNLRRGKSLMGENTNNNGVYAPLGGKEKKKRTVGKKNKVKIYRVEKPGENVGCSALSWPDGKH